MLALKNYLVSKGVKLELNCTVTGFEKTGNNIEAIITNKGKFTCNKMVLAAGSWLPQVAKTMGIKVLLQPGKGYSYTYPFVEKNIKYPAILVDGRCAVTPWGNQLRIGGTMELSGINDKVLVKRMQGIYNSAKEFYPGLKIDLPPADKIWNGLRPVSPDGLPYIGKHSTYENVVIAGGHAMLGISQATGTGKIVSDLVQHKTTPIDIRAFKIERF
jgi:D-amino-acid dehydrogenase